MVELECPSCGRVGSVPREKVNSRLVCKKCHIVFHVGANGRILVGEPPSTGSSMHALVQAAVPPPGPAAADAATPAAGAAPGGWKGPLLAVAVVGLVGLGYLVWAARGVDALEVRAKRAADALAADDLAYLKTVASPETAGDVDALHSATRSMLEDVRRRSTGEGVLVGVLVLEENASQGRGEVASFFAPSKGQSRNATIAHESHGGPSGRTTHEVITYWATDGSGAWRLDAAKSHQAAVQTGLR